VAGEIHREIAVTRVAIGVTLIAALLSIAVVASRVWSDRAALTWPYLLAGLVFLLIIAYLIYGSLVYQFTRFGYLTRLLLHRRASDDDLLRLYRVPRVPAVTVLVPAYREEAQVVRKTLLSAALQGYPKRRIVLLIDDPPQPSNAHDLAGLSAMRRLPEEIEDLLREPRRRCTAGFAAFCERQTAARFSLTRELHRLSRLYRDIGAWFLDQAARHPIADHVDELFVELTYRRHARGCFRRSDEFARWPTSRPLDQEDLVVAYRWLVSLFEVSVSSFERKRYANLSHEPNKAMNLNSYLGLMGWSFREVEGPEGGVLLEQADQACAEVSVPDADYVLMVDADSILDPEYTIRLVHLMEEPGHERIAVAQTPYNVFPGARGVLERIAGATTDIQYIIHQGFTHYGATFWVGANALARKRALEDIAVGDVERGHPIRKFIQDRTVIEDTESTVDLIDRGWELYNYPERLAFSATPPDFGALVIQRRRWANGGLIILPKLIRYLYVRGRASGGRWVREGLVRCHYLTSLGVVNFGLLVILAFPLGEGLETLWLPLTAVPYYALYTRDLLQSGYRAGDVLRVYALNLMLIPINLSGVFKSLRQACTGRRSAFGRTPKTKARTRAPRGYLGAEYVLLAQWLLGAVVEVLQGRPLHAVLVVVNAGFLAYAIVSFIGLPEIRWLTSAAERTSSLRERPASNADVARWPHRLRPSSVLNGMRAMAWGGTAWARGRRRASVSSPSFTGPGATV
jgi:cellulose synthase/poly-beta-1,6-N-acetylglucosamine synthase-like glycosyltransferase